MGTEAVTLSRERLYELVWTEPTRTVAARYGLSDRGLAKICVRLRVPVPGRGYWQRKAVGKDTSQPQLRPLPPTARPHEREVTIRPAPERPQGVVSEEVSRQVTWEAAPEHEIKVPSTLRDPHPLVLRTEKALRRAKGDQRGVLIPIAKGALHVRVTRPCVDRALRILDALVRALTERGYPVASSAERAGRTTVRILDEEIGFCLEERVRQVERKKDDRRTRPRGIQSAWMRMPNQSSWMREPRYEYLSTGELVLRITDRDFRGTSSAWRDGKRWTLETQLNRFVVGLVAVAEAKKAERRLLEENRKAHEEWQRQESERQLARLKEESRIRLLEQDVAEWAKSRRIRDYVEAMRAGAVRLNLADEPGRQLDEWLRWAAGHADRLDPTNKGTAPRDPWS